MSGERGPVKDATLYFHDPCFDGLVSGVLAWVFLEQCENWRIERFCPANYDMRQSWLSTELSGPTAVVDFLYHPQAMFWADHHLTTFITKNARKDFEERKTNFEQRKTRDCLFFDGSARSCAGMLWEHLHARIADAARYGEMAGWAEKIDSANYSSVSEAISGDAPALRISRSLMLHNGLDYSRFLLKELRVGDLSRVAQLEPVRTRFDEVRRRIAAGLKSVEGQVTLRGAAVAVFDVPASEDEIISRYVPYHFFPEARYSIGIVRSADGVKVTAMRNPWVDFESVPLGKILEEFGGGGHQRVGALVLPLEQAGQVERVVNRLISEMRMRAPMEGVTA